MYAPAPYPAPQPPRRSIWIWLGPFLGFVGVVSLVAMVALIKFCNQMGESAGVLASNEIPATVMSSLEKKHLLSPGEKVLVYYDATISGDMSEVAMVTSERLVYVNEGRTTSMNLADISDIKSRNEGLVGDIIEATSDSGELIKVEVAPMNGGPTFLSALESARKTKRGAK